MNALDREIQDCMSRLTAGVDGEYTAMFCFPPEFSGFKGHLAGHPILPGACMVQAAIVLVALRQSVRVGLRNVESAAWFVPVSPGMELLFACREHDAESGQRTVRISVTHRNKKVADLRLRIAAEPDREDGAE